MNPWVTTCSAGSDVQAIFTARPLRNFVLAMALGGRIAAAAAATAASPGDAGRAETLRKLLLVYELQQLLRVLEMRALAAADPSDFLDACSVLDLGGPVWGKQV